MNNLLGSLGLNEVTADPNDIPVGTYDAVITQSELVLNKEKDTVSHVITFTVQGGESNGAKKPQWNQLGNTPRNAQGEFPANAGDIASFNNTMTDRQKQYYKKTWVDCGTPEDQVGSLPPEALVGKAVEIRVYSSNGYKNVAVNGPSAAAATPQGQTVVSNGGPIF